MVKRFAFAVPGNLATPTGGYAYDRRMIVELEKLGWTIDVIDLGDGFPRPSAEQRAAAQRLMAETAEGRPIVIDGLAFGVLADAAASLAQRNPLIALVHHPLALESGLTLAEAEKFRASERAALAFTRGVIATSDATAQILIADYDIAAECITVARPGCDPVTPARGSHEGIVRLLAVGSLVARKGYDLLLAALATMADLPWRLTIVGDDTRDPSTAAKIKSDIARLGLSDQIDVAGVVTAGRLAALYTGADVFVLASRFEGYGMAYAEAIAYGLPVVGTTAGAIPSVIPPEAAILVAPDDAAALAQALRRLIANKAVRQRLAAAARRSAAMLPKWNESATLFARAIEAVA